MADTRRMDISIEALDGLKREEIERRDAVILEETRKNRADIDRLLRIVEPNGRPGLEDRMIAYTDRVFLDAERDYKQIGLNATVLIEKNGSKVDETNKMVISIDRTMAKWGGFIAAAGVFGGIAEGVILHFWK